MKNLIAFLVASVLVAACGPDLRQSSVHTDGGIGGADAFTVECNGTAVDTSGALNLDIKLVNITGKVTINGQPMPALSTSPGTLIFVQHGTPFTGPVEVQSDGSYNAALAPNHDYDIVWDGNYDLCGQAAVPCNRGTLMKSLSVAQSGALTIDLPSANLSGNLTVNGAALPASSNGRGVLAVERKGETEVYDAPLGELSASGASNYSVTVLKGTYDFLWLGDRTTNSSCPALPIPCNEGVVMPNLDVEQSGALNIDLPSVNMSGNVTVNGAAMPTSSIGRGSLLVIPSIEPVGSTRLLSNFAIIPASGTSSYSGALLKGTYNIVFAGDYFNQCPTLPIPCNRGTIISNLSVQTSGALAVDIPEATVSGNVTLNGAAMPSSSTGRGTMIFSRRNDFASLSAAPELATSGTANYTAAVIKGKYDILFAGDIFNECPVDPIPCNRGPVVSNLDISQSGGLAVDVPAATISGAITVNGAPMANDNQARGSLYFIIDNLRFNLPYVAATGAAHYAISLIKGTYDIGWNSAYAEVCSTAAIPCTDGPLKNNFSINTSGALDIDLPVEIISGNITLNSQSAKASNIGRGSLFVQRADSDGADSQAIGEVDQFSSNGALSYRTPLLKGNYVIYHGADESQCNSNSPDYPCVDQVLSGCP